MHATLERKPGITARLRRRKSRRLKDNENANKQFVRDRDVTCRFPCCPCRRFNLFLEVSHQEHKGMGGDPTGERSRPELMIYICNYRHKEGAIAIDRKTLRWEGLTDQGANGPVRWLLDVGAMSAGMISRGTWVELAREVHPGRLAPLTDSQREMVSHLSSALIRRFR